MTTSVIKIGLSVPALRALMADDASIEFELRKAVIAAFAKESGVFQGTELVRHVKGEFSNVAKKAAADAVKELIGREKWTWGGNEFEPSQHLVILAKSEAERIVANRVQEAIREAVGKAINNIVGDASDLEERIDRRVNRLLNEGVDRLVRDRVDKAVNAAFAKLKEASHG